MSLLLAKCRAVAGRLRADLADGVDWVLGRREELVPPRRLGRLAGSRGEFRAVGEELARLVAELTDLAPESRVLDVGCGSGRLAIPLTHRLSPAGRYDGVDVMAPAIRWCRRQVGSRFPHFRFHHLDVRNGAYNPRGSVAADEMVLPFAAGSFDIAVLTSVFTHMRGPEADHYLDEIARVLTPGGRLLATYFLLNEESERLIRRRTGQHSFRHDRGSYRVDSTRSPENAVAFREDHIRRRYPVAGFEIREPIHFGRWCGRREFLSFQDVVVATRAPMEGSRRVTDSADPGTRIGENRLGSPSRDAGAA